ncbi:MAG TPA: helix-turn-helix transcriptional regulator [Geminicoccus sp.]|uniref:helix-turn-helix domain-containing protein n=1 Tax=Geminicoccus sp. TaxID=2024832 RepID=UPI002CC334FA|nr:helix-turn-helix transcriptional regulator [Geminicoccus sp.]HWL69346.1 helix-turn-helix transcriptional regulator [Geminicoccus sp.]
MDRETLIERKIGERLRRRRIELGLTQEQVGQVIGVSYQQVQKFERGANRVSAARLILIAERLRTDIQWLCGMVDLHPPSTALAAKDSPEAGPAEVPFSQIDDPAVRAALSGLVRAVVERPGAGR